MENGYYQMAVARSMNGYLALTAREPLVILREDLFAGMKNATIFASLMCAMALLPGLSPEARATVILKLDLKQLVDRAETVVLGRAVSSTSLWGPKNRIYSDTTFKVEQDLRSGGAGHTVVVRSLGGSLDGVGMRVSGSPRFHKGDRVLLFLERRGGRRFVVGMKQGAFHVGRNSYGKDVVRPDCTGLILAQKTPAGLRLQHPPHRQGRRARLLSLFIAEVRELIQRRRPEAPR